MATTQPVVDLHKVGSGISIVSASTIICRDNTINGNTVEIEIQHGDRPRNVIERSYLLMADQ